MFQPKSGVLNAPTVAKLFDPESRGQFWDITNLCLLPIEVILSRSGLLEVILFWPRTRNPLEGTLLAEEDFFAPVFFFFFGASSIPSLISRSHSNWYLKYKHMAAWASCTELCSPFCNKNTSAQSLLITFVTPISWNEFFAPYSLNRVFGTIREMNLVKIKYTTLSNTNLHFPLLMPVVISYYVQKSCTILWRHFVIASIIHL